jgi:hypothetical protein
LVVAMLGPGMSAHAAAATADVDKDRMPDRWERAHGLRVGVNDARRDPDHDGLTNYFEYRVDRLAGLVSHPKVADSDHDGVSDGNEDLDHDGLSNEDEATLGTRLFDRDSDDDGVSDGREDADHDGLDNAFELGAVDGQDDEDGDGIAEGRDDDDHDGVSNTGEFNPRRGDSDHDGVRDGREDEDGDGLDNAEEEQLGEDPSDADSDDDGDEDGEETAGTIVAFDADTRLLTLQPPGEAELSATVAEDVELEWDEAGDGPQACADAEDPTLADLIPGRVVSDLEVEDEDGSEVVTEIELVCPTDDS